jgi:hypothetical protein
MECQPLSKKNIIGKPTQVDNNTARVSFQNDDGVRVYEYRGSSKRAIMRGKDPAALSGGRLVSFTPKETK